MYPHLLVPDTKFDSKGEFHTKVKFTQDDPQWVSLIEQLETYREEYAEAYFKENPKHKRWTLKPVVKDLLDDEGDETGEYYLNFKQTASGIKKNGEPWKIDRIPLFDSQGQPIPQGTQVWGGSKLKVSFDVLQYSMAATSSIGLTLRLKAVQIIELVQGGSGSGSAEGYGFGEVEGGYEADTSPFNDTEDDTNDADGDDTTGY